MSKLPEQPPQTQPAPYHPAQPTAYNAPTITGQMKENIVNERKEVIGTRTRDLNPPGASGESSVSGSGEYNRSLGNEPVYTPAGLVFFPMNPQFGGSAIQNSLLGTYGTGEYNPSNSQLFSWTQLGFPQFEGYYNLPRIPQGAFIKTATLSPSGGLSLEYTSWANEQRISSIATDASKWTGSEHPEYAGRYNYPTNLKEGEYVKKIEEISQGAVMQIGNRNTEAWWAAQGFPEYGGYQPVAIPEGGYIKAVTRTPQGIEVQFGNRTNEQFWASHGFPQYGEYAPVEVPQDSYIKNIVKTDEGIQVQFGNKTNEQFWRNLGPEYAHFGEVGYTPIAAPEGYTLQDLTGISETPTGLVASFQKPAQQQVTNVSETDMQNLDVVNPDITRLQNLHAVHAQVQGYNAAVAAKEQEFNALPVAVKITELQQHMPEALQGVDVNNIQDVSFTGVDVAKNQLLFSFSLKPTAVQLPSANFLSGFRPTIVGALQTQATQITAKQVAEQQTATTISGFRPTIESALQTKQSQFVASSQAFYSGLASKLGKPEIAAFGGKYAPLSNEQIADLQKNGYQITDVKENTIVGPLLPNESRSSLQFTLSQPISAQPREGFKELANQPTVGANQLTSGLSQLFENIPGVKQIRSVLGTDNQVAGVNEQGQVVTKGMYLYQKDPMGFVINAVLQDASLITLGASPGVTVGGKALLPQVLKAGAVGAGVNLGVASAEKYFGVYVNPIAPILGKPIITTTNVDKGQLLTPEEALQVGVQGAEAGIALEPVSIGAASLGKKIVAKVKEIDLSNTASTLKKPYNSMREVLSYEPAVAESKDAGLQKFLANSGPVEEIDEFSVAKTKPEASKFITGINSEGFPSNVKSEYLIKMPSETNLELSKSVRIPRVGMNQVDVAAANTRINSMLGETPASVPYEGYRSVISQGKTAVKTVSPVDETLANVERLLLDTAPSEELDVAATNAKIARYNVDYNAINTRIDSQIAQTKGAVDVAVANQKIALVLEQAKAEMAQRTASKGTSFVSGLESGFPTTAKAQIGLVKMPASTNLELSKSVNIPRVGLGQVDVNAANARINSMLGDTAATKLAYSDYRSVMAQGKTTVKTTVKPDRTLEAVEDSLKEPGLKDTLASSNDTVDNIYPSEKVTNTAIDVTFAGLNPKPNIDSVQRMASSKLEAQTIGADERIVHSLRARTTPVNAQSVAERIGYQTGLSQKARITPRIREGITTGNVQFSGQMQNIRQGQSATPRISQSINAATSQGLGIDIFQGEAQATGQSTFQASKTALGLAVTPTTMPTVTPTSKVTTTTTTLSDITRMKLDSPVSTSNKTFGRLPNVPMMGKMGSVKRKYPILTASESLSIGLPNVLQTAKRTPKKRR